MNGHGYVIDSSALLAICLGEPEADALLEKMVAAPRLVVNAMTLLEASVAAERRGGVAARDKLDLVVSALAPEVTPFDLRHLGWAREAYRRFGKGRHPAALNLGDCVTYATARHEVLPLLFKGDDFAQTDLSRG